MRENTNRLRVKVATSLCTGLGTRAWAAGERPKMDLQLFEFESCPFCRKVRQALGALDLPVVIFPCPRKGRVYRPSLAKYGKIQVPFLIDPNRDFHACESRTIIKYLFANYGSEAAPFRYYSDILVPLGSLASVFRFPSGAIARSGNQPEQLIELFAVEGSLSCMRVREMLCDLEIAYRLVPVAKNSRHQEQLKSRSKQAELPWLSDINTSQEFVGADAICEYLRRTYSSAS